MENIYDDTRLLSDEELNMHKSVKYYMQLMDYAMKEPRLLERHNGVCRLLVKIARDFPESMAENRGEVLKFPQVSLPTDTAPHGCKELYLGFEVFVSMFSASLDFQACSGEKGDVIFFLTLALWYEVCCMRDRLELYEIRYHRYEKEVNNAILQARERIRQELQLRERQRQQGAITLLPHFNVQRSDEELLAILKGLKEVVWRNRNRKRVGVFASEVSEAEWLAAMRGPREEDEFKRKKIAWDAKYVCKAFVIQYLDSQYELAEQVFCLADGKELKCLHDTNISKNKEMCDESTGKIAHILRSAMRL